MDRILPLLLVGLLIGAFVWAMLDKRFPFGLFIVVFLAAVWVI